MCPTQVPPCGLFGHIAQCLTDSVVILRLSYRATTFGDPGGRTVPPGRDGLLHTRLHVIRIGGFSPPRIGSTIGGPPGQAGGRDDEEEDSEKDQGTHDDDTFPV
jgi:hypothetical protein